MKNMKSITYRAIGAFGLALILTACTSSSQAPPESENAATTPAPTMIQPDTSGPTTSLPATAGRVLVALRPGSLPIGALNGHSEIWFIAAGSTNGPYTFTTQDELPPGITLEPDGRLWGVPTTLGTWTITITATDPQTPTETGSLTLEYEVHETEPADGNPASS